MSYREDHALALWTICGLWFLATAIGAWWRLNGMSVACCLTGLHLVLIALAECWTLSSRRGDQYPMAAMHPIFLIVAPLVNYGRNGYRDVWTQYWLGIELCYWMALVLNIILIRFWLAWNFNRLVGRTDDQAPRRRAEPKTSAIAPREQLSTDPL